MLRSILLPLDGAKFGEAAFPVVSALTRGADTSVHLLLSHQPILGPTLLGEIVPPPADLEDQLRDREARYLSEAADRLRRGGQRSVRVHPADGRPGPAICSAADRLKVDLVLMATHGRGGLKRFWLGSVADYVLRHVSRPLLLLPAVHPRLRPTRTGFGVRRVLLPTDLSPQSLEVLRTVLRMLDGKPAARITLLHVVEPLYELTAPSLPPPVTAGMLTEAKVERAGATLERLAARLRRRSIPVATRLESGVPPATAILRALEDDRFDMVAITTHGRGGLRRLLVGSVADKVVRGSQKPVLVVRPGRSRT